jgi:hypothetical protein
VPGSADRLGVRAIASSIVLDRVARVRGWRVVVDQARLRVLGLGDLFGDGFDDGWEGGPVERLRVEPQEMGLSGAIAEAVDFSV